MPHLASNPDALARWHERIGLAHEKLARLRDLAAAGTVEPPAEDRATLLVRSRLLEALDGESVDLHGHTVRITAASLSAPPLMVRVTHERATWLALHVETHWNSQAVGYEAALTYELNSMPF